MNPIRPSDSSHREPKTTIWVISDLQTSKPDEVDRCLGAAIDDVTASATEFDQIWYLGDAIAGTDLEMNERVADRQVALLDGLAAPLRYVMGNHDLDLAKETGEVISPFYDAVGGHPNWRTTVDPEAFYFTEELGGWTVLFLSDHVDRTGRWSVTHGKIHGDADRYPHTVDDYRQAIERVSDSDRPVILAGHNAFPGGNRPAEIQRRMFPLPETVQLHLYGHAHIGDEEYVAPNTYRTISYVDHHRIPQIDVASLEDRRGDTIRSAILELFPDGEYSVYLRDHRRNAWLESYHSHATAPNSP